MQLQANVLANIDSKQLSEKLQLARQRSGLTQEEAAKVIDVARTTMIAIEKGVRPVKASELIQLAEAYGRPFTEFILTRSVIQPFNSPQFRGPTSLTEQDRIDIQPSLNEFEELCKNYLDLEELVRSPMNRKYPAEYSLQGLSSEQAAENVAMEERQRLNLGDGPIPNFQNLMEQDIGLRLFYIDMPSKFSGIYYFDDQLGGCIAINRKHPLERCRMSIAHEYAHFLTSRREAVFSPEKTYQRVPESEKFAPSFAMHFLLPRSGMSRRFNDLYRTKASPTMGDLSTLAHYYQVSVQALALRLEDLRLRRTGFADSIKKGYKVREGKLQLGLEDVSNEGKGLPSRYLYMALEAFQKEIIGESELMRFLRVDRLEARRIIQELQQSGEIFEINQASIDEYAPAIA